jgi:peptide/nickel transport system permease protein
MRQDLPQVMGATMFASFFIVLANILVDVLYGVVDPRVRVA